MTAYASIHSFWAQDRFAVALVLTLFILVLSAIAYFVYTQRHRLAVFLRNGWVAKMVLLYRLILGSAAVVILALSLFPREDTGMGILLYPVVWLALILQLGVAIKMPWQKLVQRSPGGALALAVIASFYVYGVDSSALMLAGWID